MTATSDETYPQSMNTELELGGELMSKFQGMVNTWKWLLGRAYCIKGHKERQEDCFDCRARIDEVNT